jgi:hypothetical protein
MHPVTWKSGASAPRKDSNQSGLSAPGASNVAAHRGQHAAYNDPVANAKPQNGPTDKHPRHASYAAETSGLLLIAFLLLVLTVVRYWHAIPWSVR